MRNNEKFTKGRKNIHSPPLNRLCVTVLMGIYIHCGEYIYTPQSVYMSTMLGMYRQ